MFSIGTIPPTHVHKLTNKQTNKHRSKSAKELVQRGAWGEQMCILEPPCFGSKASMPTKHCSPWVKTDTFEARKRKKPEGEGTAESDQNDKNPGGAEEKKKTRKT